MRRRGRSTRGIQRRAEPCSAEDLLIGIGAALLFIAAPRLGRRRRAWVRDQFVRARRTTRDALDATVRDVSNRTRTSPRPRDPPALSGAHLTIVTDARLIEVAKRFGQSIGLRSRRVSRPLIPFCRTRLGAPASHARGLVVSLPAASGQPG